MDQPLGVDHVSGARPHEAASGDLPPPRPTARGWRATIADRLTTEPPQRWAERLLRHAEAFEHAQPELALTMRVCAAFIEGSPAHTGSELHQAARAAREQAIEDCERIADAFARRGAAGEAAGATTVAHHLRGIPLPPLPESRPPARPAPPRQAQVRQAQIPQAPIRQAPAEPGPMDGADSAIAREEAGLRAEIARLRRVMLSVEDAPDDGPEDAATVDDPFTLVFDSLEDEAAPDRSAAGFGLPDPVGPDPASDPFEPFRREWVIGQLREVLEALRFFDPPVLFEPA